MSSSGIGRARFFEARGTAVPGSGRARAAVAGAVAVGHAEIREPNVGDAAVLGRDEHVLGLDVVVDDARRGERRAARALNHLLRDEQSGLDVFGAAVGQWRLVVPVHFRIIKQTAVAAAVIIIHFRIIKQTAAAAAVIIIVVCSYR